MKKPFFFLLTTLLLSVAAFSQAQTGNELVTKKAPHLTFSLEEAHFYYRKGAEAKKTMLETVDSISIAKIIEEAIVANKVKPKDLNVVIDGDDLLGHPKFEILLNTILSKTVSEVSVRTNVLE